MTLGTLWHNLGDPYSNNCKAKQFEMYSKIANQSSFEKMPFSILWHKKLACAHHNSLNGPLVLSISPKQGSCLDVDTLQTAHPLYPPTPPLPHQSMSLSLSLSLCVIGLIVAVAFRSISSLLSTGLYFVSSCSWGCKEIRTHDLMIVRQLVLSLS